MTAKMSGPSSIKRTPGEGDARSYENSVEGMDKAWEKFIRNYRPGQDGNPATIDQYGGYGTTPLEAASELAKNLANVVGYEREHGLGALPPVVG